MIDNERLVAAVERIERGLAAVEEAKADLKEIKDGAKGEGFDVKALLEVVRLRRLAEDPDARAREQDFRAIVEIYAAAMPGPPLLELMEGGAPDILIEEDDAQAA